MSDTFAVGVDHRDCDLLGRHPTACSAILSQALTGAVDGAPASLVCQHCARVTSLFRPDPGGHTRKLVSNLKCLCREHHLLKTFWPGWHDQQLPDGTVIWTDPDGHTHTTHPGSRLLFPELCAPTAEVTATGPPPAKHTAGLTMPKRPTTRAAGRRQRIDAERRHNEAASQAAQAAQSQATPAEPSKPEPDDPPPF